MILQIVEKDTLALKYAKQLINEGVDKTVDEFLYRREEDYDDYSTVRGSYTKSKSISYKT